MENNQREIAHWEARTTETEKFALELVMCMEAVDTLAKLWDMGEDEDRAGMAKSLFSYVVWDLDIRRIVDFKLKPWADRFLTLRAELYEDKNSDNEAENETASTGQELRQAVPPRGFQHLARSTVPVAIVILLSRLYRNASQPKPQNLKTQREEERNAAVRARFVMGENTIDLTTAFGVSRRRIYQIIHSQRK